MSSTLIRLVIPGAFLLVVMGVGSFYFFSDNKKDSSGEKHEGPCGVADLHPKPVAPPSGEVKTYKAVGYDPSFQHEIEKVAKAKELGANIVTLFIDVSTDGEKIIYYSKCMQEVAEALLGNYINEAHSQGLFVNFREVQAPPEKESGFTDDKKLIKDYARFWGGVAKIAEKYKVYQVNAFGELDNSYEESHKNDIVWTQIKGKDLSVLAQAVLKEIKKHYSGRVGVGLGDPRNIWRAGRKEGFDISGFDQFQFSHYPQVEDKKLTQYYKDLKEVISTSREIADANGIDEIVFGESGVMNPDESLPDSFVWSTLTLTEKEEADYYDRLFKESTGLVDGYNAVSISGTFSVMDEPGEEVVKKWYSKLD
jgi:hypothetical protein